MSNQSEKSFATQLLDEKPQLRASLAASDLCKMYTSERGLRKITIDDVKYYVVEGYLLLDEDQLLIYANNQAAISQEQKIARTMQSAGMGVLGVTDLRGLVGVLRHELGHVLGFRHEHIRSGAPAVCPDEPLGNTIELTDYDPQSVMHYFCGGVGTNELRMSELDQIGAQQLYGQSFDRFTFVS